MNTHITIAIAGNPNSGKTTVFNNITGTRQHVGNYPGVTVEKKEGTARHKGRELNLVDLPGTYSLTAYSLEETVARNYLIDKKPDVVVDVLDASNIERNLYLATQLMELKVPLVLALNMSDVAETRGIKFDLAHLSRLFGAPIVPTVGHRNKGTEDLLDAAVQVATGAYEHRDIQISYGREGDEEIGKITAALAARKELVEKYGDRWLAVKLLERDKEVYKKIAGSPEIAAAVEKSITHITNIFGDDPAMVIAGRRYGFISGACQEAVKSTVEMRHTMSDRVDEVVMSRVAGIPIFLVLMWLMFHLTFTLGEVPMGWIEAARIRLADTVRAALPEGMLNSLVVDGIIGGVGGVLVFVPIIMLLFLAIAFLEDTGYMARAAFLMDRFMHKIGLHGKSFIPMLLGFGCAVPAIMATRTLESRRDRLITMLVLPLMSCGAQLPVYTLLVALFFPQSVASYVLFSLYLLGIILAVLMAKLFGRFLFTGTSEPFVMELPPYRIPTLKGMLIHMWERAWLYLKRAGTFLLAAAVVMWALTNFPAQTELRRQFEAETQQAATHYDSAIEELRRTLEETTTPAAQHAIDEKIAALSHNKTDAIETLERNLARETMAHSYAGTIGRGLATVLEPVGLGDWKIGTALFSGFAAKEIVVSTLGTLYSVGEAPEESKSLREALKNDPAFTPLTTFVLMIFVLIYLPCIVTAAVLKRESGLWRWPIFAAAYLTALAWIVSFVVYQGGRLMGLS